MSFTPQVSRKRPLRTIRHQRTPTDASGHQQTSDGRKTVTEVTLARPYRQSGHGRVGPDASRHRQRRHAPRASLGRREPEVARHPLARAVPTDGWSVRPPGFSPRAAQRLRIRSDARARSRASVSSLFHTLCSPSTNSLRARMRRRSFAVSCAARVNGSSMSERRNT